jgi:hypothetical protein
LSMGIVDLESLPYSSDTMLLKMLGKAESAKQAFADIIKLDPNVELRNDIIEVSIKHCIYLEEIQPELTEEDLIFMTYLQEVEVAYQKWVKKRQAEGKIEGKIEGMLKLANTMVRSKFGGDVLTLAISDRLSQLNEQQLDEFTAKIFDWQDAGEMTAWLDSFNG